MSAWNYERPETRLDDPRNIPELFDFELARRGISERQAAAYIGVSPNAVNKWHLGVQTPQPKYCRMIAAWLQAPEDYVLQLAGHRSGEGIPRPPPLPVPEVEVIPELEMVIRLFSPAEQRRWLLPAVELAQSLREAATDAGDGTDEARPSPGPYRLRRGRKPRR